MDNSGASDPNNPAFTSHIGPILNPNAPAYHPAYRKAVILDLTQRLQAYIRNLDGVNNTSMRRIWQYLEECDAEYSPVSPDQFTYVYRMCAKVNEIIQRLQDSCKNGQAPPLVSTQAENCLPRSAPASHNPTEFFSPSRGRLTQASGAVMRPGEAVSGSFQPPCRAAPAEVRVWDVPGLGAALPDAPSHGHGRAIAVRFAEQQKEVACTVTLPAHQGQEGNLTLVNPNSLSQSQLPLPNQREGVGDRLSHTGLFDGTCRAERRELVIRRSLPIDQAHLNNEICSQKTSSRNGVLRVNQELGAQYWQRGPSNNQYSVPLPPPSNSDAARYPDAARLPQKCEENICGPRPEVGGTLDPYTSPGEVDRLAEKEVLPNAPSGLNITAHFNTNTISKEDDGTAQARGEERLQPKTIFLEEVGNSDNTLPMSVEVEKELIRREINSFKERYSAPLRRVMPLLERVCKRAEAKDSDTYRTLMGCLKCVKGIISLPATSNVPLREGRKRLSELERGVQNILAKFHIPMRSERSAPEPLPSREMRLASKQTTSNGGGPHVGVGCSYRNASEQHSTSKTEQHKIIKETESNTGKEVEEIHSVPRHRLESENIPVELSECPERGKNTQTSAFKQVLPEEDEHPGAFHLENEAIAQMEVEGISNDIFDNLKNLDDGLLLEDLGLGSVLSSNIGEDVELNSVVPTKFYRRKRTLDERDSPSESKERAKKARIE